MTPVDTLASWIGEALAHHLLEIADDIVVVLDADGRILLLGHGATTHGWSRRVWVGRAWAELVHPDDTICWKHVPASAGEPEVRRVRVRVQHGGVGWRDMDAVVRSATVDGYGAVTLLVLRAA